MRAALAGLVVVVALVAVGVAGASPARAAGLTCTYRMTLLPMLYTRLYGDDNTQSWCRQVGAPHGTRFNGVPPGRIYCEYKVRGYAVFVRIISTNGVAGRMACTTLGKNSADSLTRVR